MNRKLKFTAIIIAALVLILLGTNVYANTGKVINDSTRMRKKPSASSDIVETIVKNEIVEIISEEGEWYKVKCKTADGTLEGYIRKDLLKVDSAKKEEKKKEDKKEEKKDKTSDNTSENIEKNEIIENGEVKLTENIEVQLLPLIYSCKTGEFAANTKVTVSEVIGNWCHIQAEDQDGWVLKSKIETTKATETKKEDKKEDKKEEKKEEKTSKTEKPGTKLYVTTTTLNVREKPETGSTLVDQLYYGDEVTVVEVKDNTWTKVKSGNKTGYAASEYLSTTKPKDVTSRGNQEPRNSETDDKDDTKTETKNDTKNDTKKKETSNNSKKETTNKTNTKNATTKSSVKQTSSSSSKTTKSSSKVTGADIVAYAKKFLGYRYVYGTAGPKTFDCSGFTSYVYKHFGYRLNRTSTAQRSNGKAVSKKNLQPGDILCFSGHVGIYIGGNNFIHAANSRKGVIISSLSSSYYTNHYITARRIIN